MNNPIESLLMINSKFFISHPDKFQDICYIYPPLVKDVLDNENYTKYETALTISQTDIEDEFKDESPEMMELTPFQYIMLNSIVSEEFLEIIIGSFNFFIHEDVAVLPDLEIILIGKLEEDIDPRVDLDNPRIINKDNFFDFQNMIRSSIGQKKEQQIDKDEDPRVKRIKAKARYRDRLKAKRSESPTLGTYLVAICCMEIGLNPLNIGEISYASVNYLINMYQQKEEYSINIRSMLAGAKDVKLKNWIRNLK